MLSNLIYSLDATVPVFLMMVLGAVFRKIGLMPKDVAEKINTFVFKIALPVALFEDLAMLDIASAWDGSFVLFCFVVTVLSIGLSALLSFAVRPRDVRGEFIQASYRSSAALLGEALIKGLYGTSGMGPLMILGAVPLYNAMAVIILVVTKPAGRGERASASGHLTAGLFLETLRKIITNPLIIGILLGLLWAVTGLQQPVIMATTLDYLGRLATPLGLMALGASFNLKKAGGFVRPTLFATVMKLVVFEILFLPLAVALGFTGEKLAAIMIMLGSPTTVAGYVMARNMGHDGTLTAATVALTTLLCSLTITVMIFIMKNLGLL